MGDGRKKNPCYGCKYSCIGNDWSIYCEYIFYTGHRRPCPGGKDCTVREKKTNAIELTINGKTLRLKEWAEITNISKNTIYFWYKNQGKECAEKKVLEVWNRRKEDGK
jgi:hypothetical protein